MLVNFEKEQMLLLCKAFDFFIEGNKKLCRNRDIGFLKEKMDRFKSDVKNNKMGWDKGRAFGVKTVIEEPEEGMTVNSPKRKRTS
jgi:hypothetical protein